MSKWTTKEYRCWQGVKERVLNPNHRYFARYSVLGMEEEWKTNSDAFLAYMGPQPDSTTRWTVGRIDNDVGYFKGNVRWESAQEQNRNRGRFRNNSSGAGGVTWRDEPSRPHSRAIATWYEPDGKQRSKSFSDKGISKEEAIRLATEYRERQIERLNAEGAGYAEKHGQ